MRKNYLYNIFRKKWDVSRSGRRDTIADRSRRFADPFAASTVSGPVVRIASHQFRPPDARARRPGTDPGRVQPEVHPLRSLRPGREPRPSPNHRSAPGRRPRRLARHRRTSLNTGALCGCASFMTDGRLEHNASGAPGRRRHSLWGSIMAFGLLGRRRGRHPRHRRGDAPSGAR